MRSVRPVSRRNGVRDLVVYDEDGDGALGSVSLDGDEANAVAELLGAPQLVARLSDLQQQAGDLVTEQLPVPVGSPFDGRALGWLVAQAGWFFGAHRATNDVDAVIALLCHEMADGRTALAQLVDSADCPTVRIEAVGADFHVKDGLRGRGYRWNAEDKVWWKEIAASDLSSEEFWLACNVYAPSLRPRALGPKLTEVTARKRYS